MNGVDDRVISEQISRLVDEEHGLRGDAQHHGGLDEQQQARLRHLQEQLDQAWDLLNRRRAWRAAGQDPDQAQVRPAPEVESYLQ
jgi:hypothetical protein